MLSLMILCRRLSERLAGGFLKSLLEAFEVFRRLAGGLLQDFWRLAEGLLHAFCRLAGGLLKAYWRLVGGLLEAY